MLTTKVYEQLSATMLAEQTLQRGEGVNNDTGALVISTGEFTGRSPADKFIVRDVLTAETVDWNKFNTPLTEGHFLLLKKAILDYLNRQEAVWSRKAWVCADPEFRLSLRIINEQPSGNHFAANMFIEPTAEPVPEWTIIQAPGFKADPALHGTRQSNFTVVSFAHQTILIGGTGYTGEIKKAVFTVLNFILPLQHRVLSMHCSANEGAGHDAALFFGLSGTGKTTLSADPLRKLIGDDEHGWSDSGIFNIEGGCYAKVNGLAEADEPCIYKAIRPGALVENTTFIKGTSQIDFASKTITENTRASYPLGHIPGAKRPSLSGIPKNLFFLTCDAFGVLPPVSKLNVQQALYYFINGYTARVAGTEAGIAEPQATFSACFGAPFLPLRPGIYAGLLKEKLERFQPDIWMINTGWTGGPYGQGNRISITYSRAIVNAALSGQLDTVSYRRHPVFGMLIPQSCPGVPPEILNPWSTWTDEAAYRAAALSLKEKFIINYAERSDDTVLF